MAKLGATTYTAVTWTAGDVLTEAKLDNMVANDQAYDSHAAQGLLLNNDKAYCGKDTGGTARDLLYVSTGDDIIIGEDNVLGHTVVNAGTDKLVKIKVLRQDDTSDTYEKNTVVLTGWGYIQGDAANRTLSETVTYGITFTQAPIPVVCNAGRDSTAPTAITDLDEVGGQVHAYFYAPTTTTFVAVIERASNDGADPGVFPNTKYFGYSWHAIGELD